MIMRRSLFIPTALLLSALALTGCSAASDSTSTDNLSAPAPESGGGFAQDQSGTVAVESGVIDRQVITTGYVTITVVDPLDAATEAIRITESVGGRVDGRSEYAPRGGDKGSATLTLRLPADNLTETLEKLKVLGEVQEVSLNATDVTMQTQDLDARITALSASVDRLIGLLATATDTDTLIQLETAISDRQGELESLKSQQRFLDDQVSLSTVTLNLVSEQVVPDAEPVTFLDGVVAGWNGFLAFFSGLLVVLGVLLPWLVLAGVITAVTILVIKRRAAKAATPAE